MPWRYSRFTFVDNTISNSPKVPRTKLLESDGLFCFSSICKCDSFKNPFATITSLFELCFKFRRFIRIFRERWAIACASTHSHLEMSRWAKNCLSRLFFFFYKPNGKKENINSWRINFETTFVKFSLHFMSHKLLVINKLFLKREKDVTRFHWILKK